MIRAICGMLTALCVAVLLAALSTTVRTSGGDTIKMSDACDPATFNAGIAPGTCVGDGDVTSPLSEQNLEQRDKSKSGSSTPIVTR